MTRNTDKGPGITKSEGVASVTGSGLDSPQAELRHTAYHTIPISPPRVNVNANPLLSLADNSCEQRIACRFLRPRLVSGLLGALPAIGAIWAALAAVSMLSFLLVRRSLDARDFNTSKGGADANQ